MKTKHTPGPWEVEKFHNGIHIWVGVKKLCSIWSALFPDSEIKANAKLIAAAPMTLKEMEEVLIMLQKYDKALVGVQQNISAGVIRGKLNPVIHKLGQAIKKATS